MNEIFSNCSSLISLPDISNWNTSNIFDMSKIFFNCRSLSVLPDISKWNTSNVIDMNQMFYNCSSLSFLPDISKWDISNTVNVSKIFYNCSSLISLVDLSNWNNINTLNLIVKDCYSLISLPKLSKRNTTNIYTSSILEKTYSIFKLTYIVKEEKEIKIFNNDFVNINKKKCKWIIDNKIYLLTDKYYITNNNRKNLKIKLLILNNTKIYLSYMFYECKSLNKFYLSKKDFKSEDTLKKGEILRQ